MSAENHIRSILFIGSMVMWEEYRLRVSENRVLTKVFVPKRDEVTGGGGGENCITRNCVIYTLHQV
jgi:hypothetical protein